MDKTILSKNSLAHKMQKPVTGIKVKDVHNFVKISTHYLSAT